MEELEQLTSEVLALVGLPVTDVNSHSIAELIFHVPRKTHLLYLPRIFIYLSVRRIMSNEVAYARMKQLQQRINEVADEAKRAKEAAGQVESKAQS